MQKYNEEFKIKRQSMSRKAACPDNASMENFFGILKKVMYYGGKLVSYGELKRRIEECISTGTTMND